MRILLAFLLITISNTSYGQTKADVMDCLNAIFLHHAFQPAFVSDMYRNGNLIIVSGKSSISQSRNKLGIIRQSLRKDDFYASPYKIEVLREEELEPLGIKEFAVLDLSFRGDKSNFRFRLSTTVTDESLRYTWNYQFIKVDGVWELNVHTVEKQHVVVSEW